jgi:hypothetical protein
MAHWHTTPLAIAIVCVLFLFPVIAAQTKVERCSHEGSVFSNTEIGSCKSCVNRYEDGFSYIKSKSQCSWCASSGTEGYCFAKNDRKSEEKCGGFSANVIRGETKDACDPGYIDPRSIYAPIIVLSGASAISCYKWAGWWLVSRKTKWLMIIIGLLLPIVSLFLIGYLHKKGLYFCSAATEQPPPETQLPDAIEPGPVSGAEPQGLDPSSLQQPYKSSPEEIQAV